MFCKYCGSKLVADNAAFCHECGKATCEQPVATVPVQPVPAPQPVPVQVVYQQPAQPAYQVPLYQQVAPQYTYTVPPVQSAPQQPAVDPAQLEKLEKQTLTLGIVGLCLSMLGLPGLIVSCIGAKKAGRYKQLTGGLSQKARTGYNLAKAGRAVGIVMTVLLFIVVSTLAQGDVTYDYDYSDPFEYYDF